MKRKGLALVITLLILATITLLAQFMISTSTVELRIAGNECRTKQAFWLAEACVHDGLAELKKRVDGDLNDYIQASTPQDVIDDMEDYLSDGDSILFLVDYAYATGETQFSQNGDTATLSISNTTINLGSYTGSYSGIIYVMKKGDPVQISEDIYEFPFSYRIDGQGTVNPYSETASPHLINVELLGKFTITVQKDNFAKYALFTNQQTTPTGTSVWFVRLRDSGGDVILETKFTGPVHTNGHFNIAYDPILTGPVSQYEQQPQFYNNGGAFYDDSDNNAALDYLAAEDGSALPDNEFLRGPGETQNISLPTSTDADDQRRAALGLNPSQSIPNYSEGIYVPTQGQNVDGGIYIVGDSTVSMSVDADTNAVYSITQGATTNNITVDFIDEETTIEVVGGSTNTYNGILNGVIFDYNGSITSLGGTVQQNSEVTVAASNDVVIQDHIRYEDYSVVDGLPNAEGTTNVFGIVSWDGNVRIGTSAPDNIEIHSTIMAPNGIFTVDGYDDQGVGYRGQATLLGGIITQNYGAFGLFSTYSGPLSGYGRNFIYDQRMLTGLASPYFPTLQNFIAISDLDESPMWSGG